MARGEQDDVMNTRVNTLSASSRLPPLSKDPTTNRGFFPHRSRAGHKSRSFTRTPERSSADKSNITHIYRIKSGKENQIHVVDPFRPHTQAMADRGKLHTPVSTNNPEEYANRFKSTKTQKPKVVAFDGKTVSINKIPARGVSGFFPPVKLRTSSDSGPLINPPSTKNSGRIHAAEQRRSPPFVLELAPEGAPTGGDTASVQTAPGRLASGKSGKSGKSGVSKVSHRSSTAAHIGVNPPVYPHVLQHAETYDDFSFVPKPKMMISRDNPWVYRFKVKKSMNELSKVMASKPPPNMDYTFIH